MNSSIEQQSIRETLFNFQGQQKFYRGKVRDVYWINDKLVLIASDRISAFDHILPRPIPFKGQVLNQLAVHFLEKTRHAVPNWMEASPDPNVTIGKYCEPIRIEMVIRGYLAGHAWRTYKAGSRTLCGELMPEGMRQNDPFPRPIITPAVKAAEGHDEDISKDEILKQGIVPEEIYLQMEHYTHRLFEIGSKMANDQELILVDTKYEFGIHQGQVLLMDEVHTPDSSRYFYLDGYVDRQNRGERQEQLSKEFVREWLIAHGFQGLEDQMMPHMPDDFVWEVSRRYIKLFEIMTGLSFPSDDRADKEDRIRQNIEKYFQVEKV